MLTMCGFIVLFAALLLSGGRKRPVRRAEPRPVRASGSSGTGRFHRRLSASLPAGGKLRQRGGRARRVTAPLLLGMTLGWGGLSVHCQVAAALHEHRLVGKGFFISRLLHALLGGIFSVLLFRFVPVSAAVFRPSAEAVVAPYSSSAGASAALLGMCALFLLTAAGRPEERCRISRRGERRFGGNP